MSNETIIRVENVSKKYVINEYRPSFRQQALEILKHMVGKTRGRWQREPFWALRDISFEIKKGESVALIGRNGAGKTTLLRLLSGITEPTRGRISVFGKFIPLISLGTGVNKELTGRENIYLKSAIYGYSQRQTDTIIDDIIEFSELEDFIDATVKRYSNGMIARLTFSIAVHLISEIIYLDEILAVGDAAFRKKCKQRMLELLRQPKNTGVCLPRRPGHFRDLPAGDTH